MIIVFSLLSPRAFPTLDNFTNVLNQASLAMIIAGGLTLAVVVGELDLSIGFAASLHGVLVTGLIVHDKLPIPLAIVIVLALGALIGVVNGFIVTKLKVNSVIATLGVGTIITGLRLRLFGRRADRRRRARGLPPALARPLAVRHPQQHRHHGAGARRPLAAGRAHVDRPGDPGGRRQCRRGAALRHQCRPHQDLGFVISGMCAALTGILLASRLGSGTTSAADSYLLTAFAAVFLGSATLRDGEFHVLGTFIGALIIAFGFNGLNIFGAPTFSQYVLPGRHPDRRGRAVEPRPLAG